MPQKINNILFLPVLAANYYTEYFPSTLLGLNYYINLRKKILQLKTALK